MKKVAILTIDSLNYGNKLQNYALQKVLLDLGFECETIKRSIEQRNIKIYLSLFIQFIKQSKWWKYYSFRKKIKWSKDIVSKEYISGEISEHYNYFIAGSDQIWNPNFDFNSMNDLLAFAPVEKRISYAGSFGINKLPENYEVDYKKYLLEMHRISVREFSGQKLIKDLTERNVPVVLDPTLLVEAEHWRSIAKRPNDKVLYTSTLQNNESSMNVDLDKPYILLYFLGEIPKGLHELLNEKFLDTEYQIINIMENKRNGKPLPIGPAEFVWLIEHAQLFITDSFHGVAFSINLHTKFIALDRVVDSEGDMNSRFDTIISEFDLHQHRYSNELFDFEVVMNQKFENIESIRCRLAEESMCYLKTALEMA